MKKIAKSEIKRYYNKFDYCGIKDDIPKASFLFVTRNRAPFVDIYKNPLTWSIISLINGKSAPIDEIIIVDDNSSDHTLETIEGIRKQTTINIIYLRNKERRGCSYSRQVAIKKSSNDFIFMGDDDCLYNENFVVGALISFLYVRQSNQKVAVLNLPVYERRTYPTNAISKEDIGRWDISESHFYHNFDKFPLEYLKKPKYSRNNVLMPFPVDIMYGVNLSCKKSILESGGYEDLSMWANDYSEHMELSYRLKKNGYSLYHQADPRFSSVHLKYGAKTSDVFDKRSSKIKYKGLKYNLGEMIEYSRINRKNSGARIIDCDFHINQIGSFFSFYLKVSKELSIKFAIKEYNNFVLKDQIFSTTPSMKFNIEERKDIFKKAVDMGVNISSKQTGKSFDDIKKIIFNEIKI